MKIDVHVHILSPDFIKDVEKHKENEPHFKLIHSGPNVKYATAEDVIEDMKKTGVDKTVVFGFPFKDPGRCREANDYIIEVTSKYNDKLIGFAVYPPRDSGFESEITRCCEKGLKGVGELIPDAQQFDISDQEEMKSLVSICKERNLPVLMHANEQVGHYYTGKGETGPVRAFNFAKNNPDLTIIFAHWGGGLFFYELMPEVRKTLTNVYYDNAASPFLYYPQVYDAARIAEVLPKVMLGSDFPLLSPKRYFKEMDKAALSQEEKDMVSGKTAASIIL
ncbi:MAG: amidohydrolase [Candidatus Syntrophonatronum acetioxidans]|uniref:Amidohydrolase n=1 Tax=Candidatus Syntrophonatronum acetioxidans TaxID=1795816 RepID=A0A424YGH7_9FIRM|nr:MAG: amidohydrolase [Candidatus Syntrophonatronum acetioxidans]